MFHAILTMVFGVSPADLGHPSFDHRCEAQERIERLMPYALPVVLAG